MKNFGSVPKQSRPSSIYETSLRDGVPNRNAASVRQHPPKHTLTSSNHSHLCLAKVDLSLCPQRQTRTLTDNSGQGRVPKQSRLWRLIRSRILSLRSITKLILAQILSATKTFNLRGRGTSWRESTSRKRLGQGFIDWPKFMGLLCGRPPGLLLVYGINLKP